VRSEAMLLHDAYLRVDRFVEGHDATACVPEVRSVRPVIKDGCPEPDVKSDPGSADPLDADHSFNTPDESDGREEVLCHTADDGNAQDLARDSNMPTRLWMNGWVYILENSNRL
jgi:hypothetical protein